MARIALTLLLMGLLSATAVAQETKNSDPKEGPAETSAPQVKKTGAMPVPGDVEVNFLNGSTVRMLLHSEKLSVLTPYGPLQVPVKDIRAIEFGLHFPEGVEAKINAALKNLGSEVYRERDLATKALTELGPYSYPAVYEAGRGKDLETSRRAKEVVKKLEAKHPRKDLKTVADDKIVTPTFTIVGRIVTPTIKAKTELFGEVELGLAKMRSLRMVAGPFAEVEVMVDAVKYANQGQWLETDCDLDGRTSIVITAKGVVDTWPQQPGQYITGPNGVGGARGGLVVGRQVVGGIQAQLSGGALMGEIGESGQPFLIGERFEGTPDQEGKLYLNIGPSPWNCPSSGGYDVKVTRK